MRNKPLIALVVPLCACLVPAPASAAECGTPDPKGAGALRGTLALDDEASTLTRDFRRGGGSRTLQLVFNVANCELRDPPVVSTGPLADIDQEIPGSAIGKPKIEALGDEIKVTFSAQSAELEPGTYGSLIEVRDPEQITTARAPMTISRSEPSFRIPGGIGLAAGGLGFVVFVITKILRGYKLLSVPKLALAAVFAGGAGALAAVLNWFDQDVWVWQENWKVAAATAFAQSSAGIAVVAGTGVFSEEPIRTGTAAADDAGKPRFLGPAAHSAKFWQEAFDALPPAFIKEVPAGEDGNPPSDTSHIAENDAFKAIEGQSAAGDWSDADRAVIKRDHLQGDRLALRWPLSRQIESHDTYGMSARRQIVTFKRKVEYGGRTYIVGWYVPLELPPDLEDADAVWVRGLSHMPVFRLIPQPKGDDSIKINIGESSRRAAATD